MVKLGEKIRELRKQRGISQEKLAEHLGVTFQAVSKWESGATMPDVLLIPAIANYFHVSTDELFGYDNDRETRLESCIEKFHEMRGDSVNGDFKTSIEEQESFMRQTLTEFPNEWKLQMRLAWVLESKAIEERANGKDTGSLKEAVALLAQARNNCDDEGWKDSITSHLADAYTQIGDDENRERLASESSPIFISREMLRAYSKDEKKHKRYSAEAVLELIHSIARVIDWDWTDDPDVFIAMAELYKALFGGKDYGLFNSDMVQFYWRAAKQYAKRGDNRRAIECFDLAYEHGKACDESWNKKENKPSSPFLSCAVSLPRRFAIHNTAYVAGVLPALPEDIAAEIRNDPKYASVFENQ